jgi:four helix bundle protein
MRVKLASWDSAYGLDKISSIKYVTDVTAPDCLGSLLSNNSTRKDHAGNLRRLEGLAPRHGLGAGGLSQHEFVPKQEIYGLTSQMRRAAVSVPSNIAEGKGRFSRKELLQFLFHARGSLLELQTQITIGRELGFLAAAEGEKLTDLASEVGRLLNGLVNRFQDERSFDNAGFRP